MALAAVAHHLGVLDRLAAATHPLARGSTPRLFALVFGLSALTAAVLNNDSAILLLTPLVILLVRAVYPRDPEVHVPFVFAVFMAAGVAPLVVSNPMNMIVADYAGIGFNEYALRMLPISIAGWIVSFLVLRWLFRKELAATLSGGEGVPAPPLNAGQKQVLVLLAVVVGTYPVASYFDQPVWAVAAIGAFLAVALCRRETNVPAWKLLRDGVSWETLAFLLGVFVLAIGLRNAGIIDWLADVYEHAGIIVIGSVSAVGSALINNHSMGLINVLAIEQARGTSQTSILAALIGGDLGPRLLPVGSLAGLLWYASLRRLEVEVSVIRFIRVGIAVTIPTLFISLLLLHVI
jgi:arsenical pump membrane protein